jgi:hypothetical protein
MDQKAPTVADMFRHAQALHLKNPDWSYKQIKQALVKEFSGGALPPLHNLTIPEQDARAPEEDWTAGLPLVRRGIQFQDWNEIAHGIILSLEQTENYERERGPEGDRDEWHDRNAGIDEALEKGVGKWMPDELRNLVEGQKRK